MTSGLQVLAAVSADARSESMLVELAGRGRFILRAVKSDVPVNPDTFLAASQRLITLVHPSVRGVRTAGKLNDGRLYVLTDVVEAESLAARASLPIDQLVSVGIDVARALQALHAAGLTLGHLDAHDVWLSSPPRLDVTLAGLSMAGAKPEADVHALAQVLIAAGAAGADKGPFESTVRRTLAGAVTAEALAEALTELQGRWRARTAVSGELALPGVRSGPGSGPDVVMELDLTGATLGPWQLEKVLGEGAMGRVYLAKHQRIGRLAAVKVLKAEHAKSAELVQRFIQEAQAVNAIRNEHIVEVYDFGEQHAPSGPTCVYCVMELLSGQSLAELLERSGPLPIQRAVRICQQLALALHAAHQVGVVHRDVKPENVFLHEKGPEDYVKVLDFGVAKLLKPIGELPKSGTMAGVVIGTPEYMAPEQALGQSTDFRADLYAVGLVLFELLTGQRPFHGDTFGKLVVEITQKPVPQLPPQLASGEVVPRGLNQVVARCMAKTPEERFPSAEALAEALEPFAYSGRTVLEHPADEAEAANDVVAVQKSAAPKVIAVVLGLAVVAGSAAWFLRPGPPPDVPAPAPAVADLPTPPPPVQPPPPEVKAPSEVSLDVTSEPAGARVVRTDTGEELGVTPLKTSVAVATATELLLSMDGYDEVRREVTLDRDVVLSIDLKRSVKVDERKKKTPNKKVSRDGTVDPFAQ